MSTFDAVLIGALGMAGMLLVIVAAVVAVWKVWPTLLSLVEALGTLAKLLKTMPRTMEGIQQELAYMRGLAVPQQVQQPSDDISPPPTGAGPSGPPQPFPAPIFDRFTVVHEPDAKPEDTDMEGLNQTDADLVAMEQIEALRQRGISVEEADAEHDAIEVDTD
jgi:hypothetical protein